MLHAVLTVQHSESRSEASQTACCLQALCQSTLAAKHVFTVQTLHLLKCRQLARWAMGTPLHKDGDHADDNLTVGQKGLWRVTSSSKQLCCTYYNRVLLLFHLSPTYTVQFLTVLCSHFVCKSHFDSQCIHDRSAQAFCKCLCQGSAYHTLQEVMADENAFATNKAAARGAQGRGASGAAVQAADAQQLRRSNRNQAVTSNK